MSVYNILTGDTFETIARKIYGDEEQANLIAKANPGVMEPLTEGTIIFVPDKPGAPSVIQVNDYGDIQNEVALNIEGKRFRFWESLKLNRSVDTFDTVSFSAPFDVDNAQFKDIFKPFSYKPVTITVSGEPLFSGVMLTPNPILEANRRAIDVSVYASPGVLNDCTAPASAFPLEFNGQGLRDIALTLAAPFGLAVEFEGQQGPVFDRIALDPDKKIYEFLIELARQRNFVLSSTPSGALHFKRSVSTGSPVAVFEQGAPPFVAIAPQFDTQSYYSHITGIQPTVVGIKGAQYTAENPRLKGVIRPLTFTANDISGADIKTAVESKLGRMFANVVSYSLTVSTWRDAKGGLWSPNTTVILFAPGAMVYVDYEFIIRSVAFSKEGDSETAVLKLVLPGAFEGKVPEVLPWD